MKRLHPPRRCLIALGALLLPPAVWVAVVATVPTDCARQKIAERLSRASGRKVTLGRVRVGVLGGVALSDLAIGAPRSDDDPWLRVDEATIDVSLLQVVFGRLDPTEVDARGLRLRVLRRRDGSLELADLLRPGAGTHEAPAADAAADPGGAGEPAGLKVRVRDATVLVDDEPTGTRLEFTGVEGWGTWQGCLASVTELSGTLNGGSVRLAAQFDRSDGAPRFEGQLRLRDVGLGEGMGALCYLVPVLDGTDEGLDGKLALDLYLRGQGDSRAALRQTVVGRGRVGLDPIELDGSRLLSGLAGVVDLPPQGRAGDVWADVTVKDGRVATDTLRLDLAEVPVVLSGWTDFDGRVSYRLRAESLAEKLPEKAQDLLNGFKPELKLDDLADVEIHGTVDGLVVTLNGAPVPPARGAGPGGRTDDHQRLRELARRVRDQLRR
jgi:AsmA protein